MDKNIIGVRFTKIGKIYHFDSSAAPDVGIGDHVIVDTSRGRHLGEVVQLMQELPQVILACNSILIMVIARGQNYLLYTYSIFFSGLYCRQILGLF